jgi:hypothetical protein
LLSSGVTFGISGGSAGSTTTTKTQNGLTMTINNSTGAYTLSGSSWSTEEEEFTLTGTHTSSSTTIQKVYNINKITNASNVEVSANEQAFMYDQEGLNPSPSSITLTAASYNTYIPYGTFEFKFTKSTDGGSTFSTTVQDWTTVANGGETVSISAGNLSLGNEVFKVQLRGGTSSSKIIDEDTITLLRLKDGEDGEDGDPGNKIALLKIYKSSTWASGIPTTPANSSYNFSNDTFTIGSTNTNNGWSTTIPTSTLGYSIWECEKVITGAPTATNVTVAWPTPKFFNPLFDFSPIVFKRSSTAPSAPANGTANPPTGWSATIPSGSDPVYQSKGTGSFTSSYALTYTWSTPVKVTGDTGVAGRSTKTVELFKKNDSTFSTTGSQSFNSPTSNIESGWSTTQGVLTNPGDKMYMVRRTFTSDGVGQDANWSPPVIVAQLGDGLPRVAKLFTIYNPSTSKTGITEPTDTTTGTPYNFETGAFTIGSGGSSGWQGTPIIFGTTHWEARVTVVESSFGGAQTVTYHTAYRVGGAIIRDPIDWKINWNDSNDRIELEIDGTVVSQPTYPTKIRNDQVDQAFIQNKITDVGTFRSNIGAGTSSFGGSQADIQNAITNTSTFRSSIGAGTSSFGGSQADIQNAITNSGTFRSSIGAGTFTLPSGNSGQFLKHDGTFATPPDTNTQRSDQSVRDLLSATGNMSFNSNTGAITTTATNNGTKINSSGNIVGAVEMGSKFTLDSSNERLLIED